MIGAGPRAKRNGPEKLFGVCAFFGLASTAGVRGASQYLRPRCVAVVASVRPRAASFLCAGVGFPRVPGRLGGRPAGRGGGPWVTGRWLASVVVEALGRLGVEPQHDGSLVRSLVIICGTEMVVIFWMSVRGLAHALEWDPARAVGFGVACPHEDPVRPLRVWPALGAGVLVAADDLLAALEDPAPSGCSSCQPAGPWVSCRSAQGVRSRPL